MSGGSSIKVSLSEAPKAHEPIPFYLYGTANPVSHMDIPFMFPYASALLQILHPPLSPKLVSTEQHTHMVNGFLQIQTDQVICILSSLILKVCQMSIIKIATVLINNLKHRDMLIDEDSRLT